MSETVTNTCQHCGKPIGPKAVGGLCPECLMKVGLGSGAGDNPERLAKHFVAPAVTEIAKHFPQLEIIQLLGAGGMGAVYKARQIQLDRLIALKILPADSARDPGFAERFTREARALAKLNHSNIVSVYEFGQVNSLHYFIMEYVDGVTLRQLEQSGKLSARQALQIVPQICEALQFAHDEGVVHRDIKPENVMLDKKGRVKIADFGLAKILGREPEALRLTGARDFMGTPHYMAPEQVEKPQTVDHRADIYSVGVVFYEMLTGELPLGKFQPPSKKVEVDVRLDEVVLHALEKEPDRRYQHASQVKSDIQTIATSAECPPHNLDYRGILTARELNRTDFLLTGIGLLLCVGGLIMGFSSPPAFGIPVILWGVLGFVAIMRALFATRDFQGQVINLNQSLAGIQLAQRIVLVQGTGISTAGLVMAFKYSALSAPFITFIAVVCILGVLVCLLKLAGLWPFPSPLFPSSSFTSRNLRRSHKTPPTEKEKPPSPGPTAAKIGLALFLLIFGAAIIVTLLLPRDEAQRTHLPTNLGIGFVIAVANGFLASLLSLAAMTILRRRAAPGDPSRYDPLELAIVILGTIFFLAFAFIAAQLPHALAVPIFILDTFGLSVCAMSIAGIWPFPSVFPPPTFSSRNLPGKPASLAENIKFSLARLVALSAATIVLTELAIQISGHWRESDQEGWFFPFTLYAVFAGVCVAWHFFRSPRSFGKSVAGVIGVFLAFVILWAVSDVYGNHIVPRYAHPELKQEMDMSFGHRAAAETATSPAEHFGAVTETLLKNPERRDSADGRVAELLDLDTGHRISLTNFGKNDRETHSQIRSNGVDVLGVVERGQIALLCFDMVVIPAPSNGWNTITALEISTNWNLNQQEPKPITGISPSDDKTDTWLFLTREGVHGALQLLGQAENPVGVRARYKLVQR